MSEIPEIKTQLLSDLWLPSVRRGGDIFYPQLRKNKKMKLFTLVDDKNFQEIIIFEQNGLTSKELVTVWTYSHIKKLRLETELSPARVFGPTRYEDSISSSSFSLSSHFPFDVINLDFSSQDPEIESGRVEKEIECLEKTIMLQREQSDKGFVMIYTTLLNTNSLDPGSIISTSNALLVPGWTGISPGIFSPSITDQMEKIRFIERVLGDMCSKYNYNSEFEKRYHSVGETPNYICSIAVLMKRR